MKLTTLMKIIMNQPTLINTDSEQKDYDEFVEDKVLFKPREQEQELIKDFLETFDVNYKAEKVDGEFYKPYKHASSCRGKTQNGFYVYYAFPKNSDTPVASFWTTYGEGRYKFVHIDMGAVMNQVIKYYQQQGHVPPPQRSNS